MASAAISKYFDATENREIRDDLRFAVESVVEPRIAIDCGCGAGADIGYLISKGFFVYAFDVEEEAVSRCNARFHNVGNVSLSRSSFSLYSFPKASLVVADASLFFCPKSEFAEVWRKIYECLNPGGIFCGSFLGPEDTMAGPRYRAADYWPDVAVFEAEEVRELFAHFEILRFNVHKSSGTAPTGELHDWHVFSAVAKKPDIVTNHAPSAPDAAEPRRL
jgi:SAM-dependent methyltransferase